MNSLTGLLKKRWYPLAPQIITFVIFMFMLFNLLVGPSEQGSNPGAVITWLLWWPLVPLTFVLAGRFWCVICPFGTVGDWARKLFGLNRPVPSIIKDHGLWIINGLFLLITWYDVAFGLTKSVPATAILLILVLTAALGFSFFYEKRTWCRYLCPLGGIFGNYSQTAAIELRGNPEICKGCKDLHCFKGREDIPGCALFISPKNLHSNRTCNLCGDCLKSCEKSSPQVLLRDKPGNELWGKLHPRFDESLLAASLIGLISISTLGMLEVWPAMVKVAQQTLNLNYTFVASLYLFLLVATALGVYALGALVSSKISHEGFTQNFSRFGYALIPLNLTTHFAHNLNHFLGEGKLIGKAALALFVPPSATQVASSNQIQSHGGGAGLLSDPYIQALQFGLVGLGILLSFYVVKKIALADGREETIGWPHYTVIAIFGFISFWLFSLPMSPRH